jgi:tetratricopeptide (TPR) repeat protein
MYLKLSALSFAAVAFFGCANVAAFQDTPRKPQLAATGDAPLAGENSITNLQVTEGKDGVWRATYEYFYTGAPANVSVILMQNAGGAFESLGWGADEQLKPLQRGRHVETFDIPWPGPYAPVREAVKIELRDKETRKLVAEIQVRTRIEWQDEKSRDIDRGIAQTSPEAVVERAAEYIDNPQSPGIEEARTLLERVVLKHPRTHSAYVELARVVMKTNWNADGLRQAESLIKSALEIKPDSADAKILLGYVHAFQKRFKESEALFVEASRTHTKNLWLWVNWGQLLKMQNRNEEALAKLRVALQQPPTNDKNDYARKYGYSLALSTLEAAHRIDETEVLLRQRVADYGRQGCGGVDYARFLLVERGDTAAATRLLQDQGSVQCGERFAREVLGLAQYVGWSDSMQGDLLRQARAVFPASPQLFQELASHDRLMPVARKLMAAGERLDVQDKDAMNALGYALSNRNTETADRLIKLGARVDTLQGSDRIPVALIPVLARSEAGVRLMQKAGVDYKTLRYRGVTALEYARQTGDSTLVRALGSKPEKL